MATLYETFYQTELDKLKPLNETDAIQKTAKALSKSTLKYVQSMFDIHMKIPYFLVNGVLDGVPVAGIPAFISLYILDSEASVLENLLNSTLILYTKTNQTILYSKIFQTIGNWVNSNIYISVSMVPNDSLGTNQFFGYTIWNCLNFNSIPGIFTDINDKINTNIYLQSKKLDPTYVDRDDPDSLPQLKISILTDGLLQGFAGNIVTPIVVIPGAGLSSSVISAGTAIPISPSIIFIDSPSGQTKISQLNSPNVDITSLLRPKMSTSIEPQVNSEKTSLKDSVGTLKQDFSGSDLSVLDDQIKILQNTFSSSVTALSVLYSSTSFANIIKAILLIFAPFLIVMFLTKFINGIKLGAPSEYIKLIDNDSSFNDSGLIPTFNDVKDSYPSNVNAGLDSLITYFKNTYNITDAEQLIIRDMAKKSNMKNLNNINQYNVQINLVVKKISSVSRVQLNVLPIINNDYIQYHIAGAIRG